MTNTIQNLLQWLFNLNRREKQAIQITFDALIVPFTFLSAYYMRLETTDFLFNKDTYFGVLISLSSIFCFYISRGSHNIITRHISIETAYIIAIGSAISCAALFTGILIFELQIPRSVPVIFAVLLFVFSLAIRLLIRTLSRNFSEENRENVAIYGAGVAGIQLMESLRQSTNYQVRFFIDDDPDLNGKNLGGIPIYSLERAKKKFETLVIQTLLLATPSN